MDPLAAKYLGAGLACIGMGGAAIGVANVFGQFLVGAHDVAHRGTRLRRRLEGDRLSVKGDRV